MENIGQWFPNIKHVRSESSHKLPELVQHDWIEVDDVIKRGDVRQSTEQRELDLLIEVIKQSKSKSIMVFAETKKSVDKICDALRQAEIKSLPYYPDIAV